MNAEFWANLFAYTWFTNAFDANHIKQLDGPTDARILLDGPDPTSGPDASSLKNKNKK